MKRIAVILSIVIVALLALSVTACMTAKKKAAEAVAFGSLRILIGGGGS